MSSKGLGTGQVCLSLYLKTMLAKGQSHFVVSLDHFPLHHATSWCQLRSTNAYHAFNAMFLISCIVLSNYKDHLQILNKKSYYTDFEEP
jgi:hypothetical protein